MTECSGRARTIGITGVSGARGRVGDDFNAAACLRLAASFAAGRRPGPVAVGRDTRPSGVMAAAAVTAALLEAGRPVIDLGVCPTPTIECAVPGLGAAGGVIITASHNPAEWNGLKFLDRRGLFLSPAAAEKVFRGAEKETDAPADPPSAQVTRLDAVPGHIEKILSLVDSDTIAARKFRVAVDAVNGAAWQAAPDLMERLGVAVIPLNCEPTGCFAHDPEPRPENLADLGRAVRDGKADLGLAFDPDGDRLALVSERGRPLSEELTLALCVDGVLARHPGPVVINLSTSMIIEDLGRRHGATVIRVPVGEYFVARRMLKERSSIGGEGNGGVIHPACHPGRDGLMAAALVLEYLACRGLSLSEASVRMPAAFLVKVKAPRPEYAFAEAARRVAALFPGRPMDRSDGLRIGGEDWWCQVRFSRTEPVVRILTEARTQARAAEIAGQAELALTR